MKKFFGILALALLWCNVASANDYTYLKCGKQYYQFNGYNFYSKYNIRTKTFTKKRKITKYDSDKIIAEVFGYYYGSTVYLDRNTGEIKFGYKGTPIACEVISLNQLPKLNQTGKVF